MYERGVGLVLDEPSVVALDGRTERSLRSVQGPNRCSVALLMLLSSSDRCSKASSPTSTSLNGCCATSSSRCTSGLFARPRLLICVPSRITDVEQRAVRDAGYSAGARKVYLIEEPMAAAIGADLPVHEPVGSMVVDIGGGTTEVAVISSGGIVVSSSTRIGAGALDDRIVSYLKSEFSVLIGDGTAERLKMQLGSAFPVLDRTHAEVSGRDLVSGLPCSGRDIGGVAPRTR